MEPPVCHHHTKAKGEQAEQVKTGRQDKRKLGGGGQHLFVFPTQSQENESTDNTRHFHSMAGVLFSFIPPPPFFFLGGGAGEGAREASILILSHPGPLWKKKIWVTNKATEGDSYFVGNHL